MNADSQSEPTREELIAVIRAQAAERDCRLEGPYRRVGASAEQQQQQLMRDQLARWDAVVKEGGIKPE
jgi:hypothetical protein